MQKIVSTRSAVVTINGAIGGGVVGTVYRYMNCCCYDLLKLTTEYTCPHAWRFLVIANTPDADPGEGPGGCRPPLLLDQTEARRA